MFPAERQCWKSNRYQAKGSLTVRRRSMGVTRRYKRICRCLKKTFTVCAYVFCCRVLVGNHVKEVNPSRTVGKYAWLSTRSRKFATRWGTHKVRNLVTYACIATSTTPVIADVAYTLLTCPDVFYSQRWRKLFVLSEQMCVSHRCLVRFGRNHFIHAEFVLATYEQVMKMQLQPAHPTVNGKVAVLIEPREHPLLIYVVKQVMNALGSDWALHLFLSEENEVSVKRALNIVRGGKGEHIGVTLLSKFGLNGRDMRDNTVQSALSVHAAVYDEIVGEHILWFQLDVILRRPIPSHMLKWGYIGSEWRGCEFPDCNPMRCALICGGGNSGLSLRRKSTFKLIVNKGRLPQSLWGDENSTSHQSHAFTSPILYKNSQLGWFEDDLFISARLGKLGLLPQGDVQRQFGISETYGSPENDIDPVGLHKPWLVPRFDVDILSSLLQKPFDAIFG